MSGPNRKLRRAMEVQARKNLKVAGPPVAPENFLQTQMLQKMYDQRTFEVMQLEQQLVQQQAITAGMMIQLDLDEITLSVATIESIKNDIIAGFDKDLNEDGSVTISLVFHEEDDGDDIKGFALDDASDESE